MITTCIWPGVPRSASVTKRQRSNSCLRWGAVRAALAGARSTGYLLLAGLWSQQGEQNHIPDRPRPGQNHRQPIDPDAFAARRRQSVRQRPHVVHIHLVGFLVAPRMLLKLALKAAELF